MPITAPEIESLRKFIKSIPEKENQLKQLAIYDANKALPVVLCILKEIHNKLIQTPFPSNEINSTINFIAYGIVTLEETNQRQNVGLFGIRKALKGLSREKIEGELIKLVNDSEKFEVTHETNDLWAEVSLWLEGLYKRTYDKVPKNQCGELIRNRYGEIDTVDIEDFLFKTFMHMTKFEIVTYYHQLAQNINMQINEYQIKQLKIKTEDQSVNTQNPNNLETTVNSFYKKGERDSWYSVDFLRPQPGSNDRKTTNNKEEKPQEEWFFKTPHRK